MPKKAKADKTQEPVISELEFEQALETLEQIVGQMESGQLSLSQGLSSYERGIACLKRCYAELDHAERRVELLSRVDAEGQMHVEPFDDRQLEIHEGQAGAQRPRAATQGSRQASRQAGKQQDSLPDGAIRRAREDVDDSGRLF